jgi:pimeloyl-ACP methyl ester carboxylesterase
MRLSRLALIAFFCPVLAFAASTRDFHDRTHYSNEFGEWRHYRILLPRDYETSGKFYPVIYYFHGHSGRFMGEQYGNGQVFLPEMIDYVRDHDVIVVRWDGYVEENYSGLYGGSPYDIQMRGKLDFGPYFEELAAHIDSSYRTLADRQHRATCGLSMGGYMSLYISARYPHLIGSASAYNPAHEFSVGPVGAKVYYMHKDHVLNHGHTRVRLIRSSGDYISQYHEEMREVYSRTPEVDFEFRRDEFNRHYVTNLHETFDFHMQAFEDAGLTAYPKKFDYDNAFEKFSVWGYRVEVENKKKGFVCLRDVTRGHFRIYTREYFPDGPSVDGQKIRITTPDWYGNRKSYRIMDYSHANNKTSQYTLTSSADGRLTFEVDGVGHDISVGNGKEARAPVLLPPSSGETPVVRPDTSLNLPIRLLNTCDVVAREVTVSLSSEYPTVEISGGSVVIDSMLPGEVVDISGRFSQRFVSSEGFFQHCRLNLNLVYAGWHGSSCRLDADVLPTPLETPDSVEILDGRELDFSIFRQAGNQGGGSILKRTYTEGTGNGDGKADPGEELTVWICLPQGLDPHDKYSWHRTKVFTGSPYVTVTADIAEPKEREWTSATNHTCRIMISPDCPPGSRIELVLKSESYSFVWQPDYKFGRELLYQARQFHRKHLHRYSLTVGE